VDADDVGGVLEARSPADHGAAVAGAKERCEGMEGSRWERVRGQHDAVDVD